jgi:hypothetical protein
MFQTAPPAKLLSGEPSVMVGEPTVIVPADELHELASGSAEVFAQAVGEQVQTLRTRPARRQRHFARELIIGLGVVLLCLGSFAVGFRLLNLTMGAHAANGSTAEARLGGPSERVEPAPSVPSVAPAEMGTALLPGPEAVTPNGQRPSVSLARESLPDLATAPSATTSVSSPRANAGARLRPPRATNAEASANSRNQGNVLDTPLRPPAD